MEKPWDSGNFTEMLKEKQRPSELINLRDNEENISLLNFKWGKTKLIYEKTWASKKNLKPERDKILESEIEYIPNYKFLVL